MFWLIVTAAVLFISVTPFILSKIEGDLTTDESWYVFDPEMDAII